MLGGVTLLACILFNIFAKSYFKQLSVLFGLVVGYILAIVMGMVDFCIHCIDLFGVGDRDDRRYICDGIFRFKS